MIGVNVAVRAGAQGIGFAIPVDAALQVAAELLSIERMENKWHGMVTVAHMADGPGLVVRSVANGGPAAASGLKPGDVVRRVNGADTQRPLDIELALLGKAVGDEIPVEVLRDDQPVQMNLSLAARGRGPRPSAREQQSERNQAAWSLLGMDLSEVSKDEFASYNSRYSGGMRVTEVRPGGPAAKQGIREGDILVGMHEWETASDKDIRYLTTVANLPSRGPVVFYILRDGKTHFGHLACNGSKTRR